MPGSTRFSARAPVLVLHDRPFLIAPPTARARVLGAHDALDAIVPAVAPPPTLVDIRDEVGAGDAFAAGFVYGLLEGYAFDGCARAGHLIAGYALKGTGDWETLPRSSDVAGLLRPS